MHRPLPDSRLAGRRQALHQARHDPRHLPAPDRTSERRRALSISSAARIRGSAAPRSIARCSGWSSAGIARKVDFGEGRFALRARLPASAALPSHLHDLPPVVRVPELRHRDARRGSRHGARVRRRAQRSCRVFGTCEDCRTGTKTAPMSGTTTELVFARDALRIAIATERSGLDVLHARGGAHDRCPRTQRLPAPGRRGARTSRHAREAVPASSLAQDPLLESRPTFLFFKGAANGLFAAGAEELKQGRRRSAGAAHRDQVRARLASVLQALRRALRGLRGQAHLPRVRRRGARASRSADPRVPIALRAAGGARRQAAPAARPRPAH